MANGQSLDLALIMCPGWGVTQPPIGISGLKSFLEDRGITVKCFDLSLELYEEFPEKKYWDLNFPESFTVPEFFERNISEGIKPFIDIWAEKVLSYNPRAVGFSLYMSSIIVSLLLARRLKEIRPDLLIIGGGPEVTRVKRVLVDGIQGFASINKEAIMSNSFDIFVDGEGEQALLEILSSDKQKNNFRNLDGILYKDSGKLIVNKPRALIDDLNILPPPDYSDFTIDGYSRRALPLVTSRGCINRCTFCADSPLWKKYRYVAAEKVLEDIKFLIREYAKNEFEIVDSAFNGEMRRVQQICDLIIQSRLDIFWSAKVGLRPEMNYEILKKLKRAGCTSLAYGVESGSPSVVRDMRKNIDLEVSKRIIKDTCRAGIQANCFFIIGYPTETEEDFQKTLSFIQENAEFIHRFDQITGCHIEEDSYLGLNLDKYGIVFKEDGWYSKESTPEIRKERLQRFRDFARKLHKHYQCEVQL